MNALLAIAVAALAGGGQEEARMRVWTVDSLVKVFRDAVPGEGSALAEVARGEHATWQVVVRSETALSGLRASVGRFAPESGKALTGATVRFVGYVPMDRPIQEPPADQLRKPPADFPDPLLEDPEIDVAPGQAQPVWVTLKVPTDAAPGSYVTELRLTARAGNENLTETVPLKLQVYSAAVGESRLWVTNWFGTSAAHMEIKAEPYTPGFWRLLRRYAQNMAAHRQNVALTPPLTLAEYSVGADGELEIDFSRFDHWVDIFTDEGAMGRIEGGHLGGRTGGWSSQFGVQVRVIEDGSVVEKTVSPSSEEADWFYSRFLPALQAHLIEKGWLDRYMQHLADEPIAPNIESYRQIADLVRKYAPRFRVIEACHTKDLIGAIDIWVPQLNYYHDDYEHYQARQAADEEVWFYTCVFPQGEYANRFIEQPLLKTRLLHWINYQYGATGYLHWGYNQWVAENPFTHTTREHPGPPYLPAGDPWIVYPGKDGPVDSIRHEAMRDGIADYELLSLLAETDPSMAHALAARHVLAFDKYQLDVADFRATRRELLTALSEE